MDVKNKRFTSLDGARVEEGDVISIDGTTGEVFAGEVPVVDSSSSGTSRATRPRRATSSCSRWSG